MRIHNLVQGSPEWKAHRAAYFNASDAPAMLGCSPYKTRNELLDEAVAGIEREIDAATQRRFDDGHRYEALARPLGEKIIGEDLYPVVGSEGVYSASFDGLTIGEDIAFEHKSLNDELRAIMTPDCTGADLPKMYRVQMEQQCMVSGALRILFMASKWDGDTLVEERHCWYYVDLDLRAEIIAGWEQFAKDALVHKPAPVVVQPIGKTPENLPALRIEVTGQVTTSNLKEYKEHALAVFSGINRDLKTDQDFADAMKVVKWCGEVEDKLEAAKQHALSQTESIDELFRTIDDIRAEARRTRLELDKLVESRKQAVRLEIQNDYKAKAAAHIAMLNERLGKPFMPTIPVDFAGAMKGLRTIDSVRNAVDTALANFKIAANEAADSIQFNLVTYKELASEHEFLFPDLQKVVLKAKEDFSNTVRLRIAEHKEAERIKAEAKAKADAEAAARQAVAAPEPAPSVASAPAPTPAPSAAPAPAVAPAAAREPAPAVAPAPANTNVSPFPAATRRTVPSDDEIIAVVANAFEVDLGTALGWIRAMDVFQKALVIQMQQVESHQIKAVGHDPATNTLAIEFKPSAGKTSGSVYHYKNVTPEQFAEFLQAESIGGYFAKHIKADPNRYPYLKLDSQAA